MVRIRKRGPGYISGEKLLPVLERAIADSTIGSILKEQWVTPQIVIDAIQAAGILSTDLMQQVTTTKFNKILASTAKMSTIQQFDASKNLTGIFKVRYNNMSYYYFTEPGTQIRFPILDQEFEQEVKSRCKNIHFHQQQLDSTPAPESTTQPNTTPAPQQLEEEATSDSNNSVPRKLTPSELLNQDYWDSSEARKLFGVEKGQCVKEVLARRIRILKSAQQTEGWRNVVIGRDHDNQCLEKDIQGLRHMSLFLLRAYQLALEHMNKRTWNDCCEESVKNLNILGFDRAKNGNSVQVYNLKFRENDAFPHPQQLGKRKRSSEE